jgi:outer membrane autotransporter protein
MNGGGRALLIGALFGYNNSIMRFDADRTKATYRVFNVGGYASYMTNGGLSADLLVKDDIARVDLNVPGVPGLKDVDGNSFGVKGTLGQRVGMGSNGFFIQPLGSLAYVRSTLKNISDPSATFDFADANSFRGTVGLNFGADTNGVGGFTYHPLVFLGVGHEFEGKNRVDITSGSTSISFKDKPMNTFGIVSFGLDFSGQNGVAGFVKGDRIFSKNTNGWQIQAGVRMTN